MTETDPPVDDAEEVPLEDDEIVPDDEPEAVEPEAES
jgi:hypothetical protein